MKSEEAQPAGSGTKQCIADRRDPRSGLLSEGLRQCMEANLEENLSYGLKEKLTKDLEEQFKHGESSRCPRASFDA